MVVVLSTSTDDRRFDHTRHSAVCAVRMVHCWWKSITQVHRYLQGVFWQCFKAYCMMLDSQSDIMSNQTWRMNITPEFLLKHLSIVVVGPLVWWFDSAVLVAFSHQWLVSGALLWRSLCIACVTAICYCIAYAYPLWQKRRYTLCLKTVYNN